ncbi:N-acetylglucosamine kinase [Streptomyces sp. MAR4 CNX-425]|uniref:N-acetylglucosamine kinase n=1 Tax=Streptomyces sp. MAR4 CNX-425 TaxID=3406343 RepID=UPI003B50EA8F
MTSDTARWVLGIDSGGSGLRIAAAAVPPAGGDPAGDEAAVATAPPVGTGDDGLDADDLLGKVLPAARTLLRDAGAESFDAVCVGAAGMASLGDGLRASLPRALPDALGVRRLALAADGVTAYAGAVGQHPGAVVAAGTGMIAVGTALDAAGWRRADGWGHLLGDCGGGAWIGRAGLEAAMRAHDGRRGGSAALLARMEAVFGTGAEMPGLLYPRPDRPAVLASFAPEVARCAPHDPVSAAILAEAGGHIAAAAVAVCPADPGSTVALTGGLFGIGEPLLAPLRAELAERLPRTRVAVATASPLAGAVRIAAALAAEELLLPVERGMLDVW